MRKEYQKSRELARGKEVFIGVDVHKDSWHVTVRQDGEEKFHGRIPSSHHAFKKLLERYRECTIKVAYEAGPFGFWLYDHLIRDGIETIVVPESVIFKSCKTTLLIRKPRRIYETARIRYI